VGVHPVVRGLHGGGLRPRYRRPAQRQHHGQEKWTGSDATVYDGGPIFLHV